MKLLGDEFKDKVTINWDIMTAQVDCAEYDMEELGELYCLYKAINKVQKWEKFVYFFFRHKKKEDDYEDGIYIQEILALNMFMDMKKKLMEKKNKVKENTKRRKETRGCKCQY